MADSNRVKKSSRKRALRKMTVRRSDSEESSSSYSSSYSPTKPSVTFADTRRIRLIPAISSMSKRSFNDSYFSEAECEKMKEACVRVIRKVVFRAYKFDIDGLESEFRGLEKKTREGSDQRKANRDCALLAVLNEQKKQRKHPSIADVEKIAQKYRQASKGCKEIAIRVAAHDANLVHQQGANSALPELKPSELLPTPRTKKSTPEMATPVSKTTTKSTTTTTPASPTPAYRPTLAWNMTPHDETFSHKRILSMMNAKKLLGGSQRQLALAV